MSMFSTEMPDVQAHVSITQGVQDNTAARVVDLAGQVGRAAWQGKLQADLVGAEGHEDSVSAVDEYGAFDYDDEGNPLRLAIDTDLTKLSNARKQGRLSAGRMRAQANLRIREAINDNPMFAKEIAERGQRFFGATLGGVGGGGGSVLQPTSEEQLEDKLHEQQVVALAREELEAHQLGLDVATYREYQRRAYMHKFNQDQLASNEKLNLVEIQRGISSSQALAESDLMARFAAARATGGDLLAEPVRQELRAAALHHRNTMISAVNRHRADIGATEATAVEANLTRWADNMIELVDSGNLEEMADAGLQYTETMAKLQTWQEMPSVVRLFTVSPELGKMHLDMLTSNPARLKLLASAFPAARFLQGHAGADSFDAAQVMAPYIGEAMIEYATGERTPPPEGMEENQDMEVARDFAAVESIAAGHGNYPMLEHLQEMAIDTPESLSVLLTRGNRQKMRNDPTYFREAEQALRVGVEGIQRSLVRGDFDLGMVNVRPTTEKEQRMANHPRVGGVGGGRWRGLNDTRVEPNPGAALSWAISRQGRGGGDRGVNPNDVAKRLQTVISVAEQYPDMKINGVNAQEYITAILGGEAPPESPPAEGEDRVSLLDSIISPANATFGDTMVEPGSIADQDANGTPFLQDVELNDPVIGGEEGSGVGGMEASALMDSEGNMVGEESDPNSVEALGVDYEFIRAEEEHRVASRNLIGFVPRDSGGVIGSSGVTVGTGIDLGQQSVAGLRNIGISEELINKVKPYLGVTTQAAVDLLEEQPLSLSREEVDQLNKAFLQSDIKAVLGAVDRADFMALEPEARTVTLSLVRNFGSGVLDGATVNLITAGNYKEAALRLLDPEAAGFKNRQLDARRKREGELLMRAHERRRDAGGDLFIKAMEMFGQ